MGKLGAFLLVLLVLIPLILLACSAGEETLGEVKTEGPSGIAFSGGKDAAVRSSRGAPAATAAPAPPTHAPVAAPAATPAPPAFSGRGLAYRGVEESKVGSGSLLSADRKVISSASLSIEVQVVPEAEAEVQRIAESVGGFVENLTSSGGPERQRATITVRVPPNQFYSTVDLIAALGTIQARNLGSEDVSEQFIDLEARLKSALKEEESLLSLLDRASAVSEVLAIERELFRVREAIERFQGQLNFLERRVELATIVVSLTSPEVRKGDPPSGNLVIHAPDVVTGVENIKGFATSQKGVVDRVFLSQRDGREQAQIAIRVFSAGFDGAMRFLETQGNVRSKEISEGTVLLGQTLEQSQEPEAAIEISLVSKKGLSNGALIAAIAGPLGGIALAGVLGRLFYSTYQAGRRQGD